MKPAIVDYKHGIIKDFVPNWEDLGLDPGSRCFQAVRNDGAVALVPYSDLYMDHVSDPGAHLQRLADVELAKLGER